MIKKNSFDVAYRKNWKPKLNTSMHPSLLDPSCVLCDLHQLLGMPQNTSNLLRKNTTGYPYYGSCVTRIWREGE